MRLFVAVAIPYLNSRHNNIVASLKIFLIFISCTDLLKNKGIYVELNVFYIFAILITNC